MKKQFRIILTLFILGNLALTASAGVWENYGNNFYTNDDMLSELEGYDGDSGGFIPGDSIYPASCTGDISDIDNIHFKFTSGGRDVYGVYHGVNCWFKLVVDTGYGSYPGGSLETVYAKYRAKVQIFMDGIWDYTSSNDYFNIKLTLYAMHGRDASDVGYSTYRYNFDKTFSGTYTFYVTSSSYIPSGRFLFVKIIMELKNKDSLSDPVGTDFSENNNHKINFGSVQFQKYYTNTGGGGWDYL